MRPIRAGAAHGDAARRLERLPPGLENPRRAAPMPLAVATVRKRTVWWQPDASCTAMEQARTKSVPYDQAIDFDTSAYQALSFWRVLWDYVQRCPVSEVQGMLAPRYWAMRVRLHRTSHLPTKPLGWAAHKLLSQIAKGPTHIHALLQPAHANAEDQLRALVGLLLIRAITAEKDNAASAPVPEGDSAYNPI